VAVLIRNQLGKAPRSTRPGTTPAATEAQRQRRRNTPECTRTASSRAEHRRVQRAKSNKTARSRRCPRTDRSGRGRWPPRTREQRVERVQRDQLPVPRRRDDVRALLEQRLTPGLHVQEAGPWMVEKCSTRVVADKQGEPPGLLDQDRVGRHVASSYSGVVNRNAFLTSSTVSTSANGKPQAPLDRPASDRRGDPRNHLGRAYASSTLSLEAEHSLSLLRRRDAAAARPMRTVVADDPQRHAGALTLRQISRRA